MRCARSWFNGTLYKKNLTRFWPIWGVYLLVWLFIFPINLILDNYNVGRFAYRIVLEDIISIGLPMAVVFALLAAAAVWSYLCNNRSACLMHTLPIRREGLFFTNFLSGMTFMVGPNLVVFLLTLLAEGATGVVDVGALAVWFLAVSLMELFFFCFATLCAMCTGHILGLPAFYAIFNGLATGLVCLIDLALGRFVFGYTGVSGIYYLAEWLTPIWKLAGNLEVRLEQINGEVVQSTAWLSGFGYILVYVLLGLIMAALALVLYRRRHMERAGDVITVSWMRPVFQYGVASCSALAFGSLLFEMFHYELPDTAWTLLFFMILCGAVGYFVAKMLLEKSFRVFGCWKGYLPMLAMLAVLTCAMEFDLTGYERRVPDAGAVESVLIYNINTAPYDGASWAGQESANPEVIRAAIAAHQTIVENKNEIEDDSYGGSWEEDTELGYSHRVKEYTGFHVTYLLKNGKSLRREYSVPVFADDLSDPNSVTAKLDTLVNLPQMIETAYGLSDEKADEIIEINLTGYRSDTGYTSTPVSKDAYDKVFRAVLLDLEEGRLGRRYLLDDKERMNNCFVNDLEFVFYRGKNEISPGANVSVAIEDRPGTEPEIITNRITVTLQTTAKHTLAALKETGVLESPVDLMTKAQQEAGDNAWNTNGERWTSDDLTAYIWDTLGE